MPALLAPTRAALLFLLVTLLRLPDVVHADTDSVKHSQSRRYQTLPGMKSPAYLRRLGAADRIRNRRGSRAGDTTGMIPSASRVAAVNSGSTTTLTCDLQSLTFQPLPLSQPGDSCCTRQLDRGRTSQSQEDKAVHNRYFCGRGHGVFVEMGALDGLRYSNTKLFEESPLDWRGVLVEANPVNAAKVPRNRPHATLVAEAACPEGVGTVDFVGSHAVGGVVDTMTAGHRRRWVKPQEQVVSVPCRPLGAILAGAGITFIDFFSLDVEGGELQVLQTMDWSIPVRVWVVEMSLEASQLTTIVELMARHGYECQGFSCEGGWPSGWDIKSECLPGHDCSANVVFENSAYVTKTT